MSLDAKIVITKGFAFVLVGIFTPWTAALSQYINLGEWPPKIIWIAVILPASAIGGASAWVAFCSGAFTAYVQQKKADDSQETQTVVTEPTKPKVETPIIAPQT